MNESEEEEILLIRSKFAAVVLWLLIDIYIVRLEAQISSLSLLSL
jgi:hypothetical protein